MSRLKNLVEETLTTTNIITTDVSATIPISGVEVFSAQCVVDVNTPSAKTFDSGAANVSDTTVVADTGVKEVTDVTCVAELGTKEVSTVTTAADVAGSLNSTFFLFSAMNTGGATQQNFYVWLNINSAGVDPAVVGATGIVVAAATNASANTIAGVMRSQITSIAGAKVTVTGATDQCVITGNFMGNATNILDGSAATGFGLTTTTPGVASNLNSKYFNYETRNTGGATVNLRYVWYNVNGEGVDPAPASRTGIVVPIVLSAKADTDVATATKTALAADTKVAITGSTTHCILTNSFMGTVVDAANGTASPGFSYSITQGVASNLLNKYMTFSQTLNAVNYYAWFNINSEGTDPAVAGKTGIEVTGAAAITANNLATAARAAIDSAIGSEIVISGATSHIILTNSTRGTCTATANGTASPGFTISNSPVGVNTEVDPTLDTITIPSHGLTTGLKGQLTTTGTLPTGLSLSHDYFIIAVDADTVQLGDSLALALAGTAVTIDDTGADNSVNTFTATAIAGATVKLQKSNDNSNWTDEGSATSITADASIFLEKVNPSSKYMRLSYTLTAGSISASNLILGKGSD